MLDTETDAKETYLHESEIFRDLTPEQVKEIAHMAPMSTCHRGRVLFSPDDAGEVLFILKAGSVSLYRVTEDGRKIVTSTVKAGSIFGEMALLGQEMPDTYAEALEDCTICVMSREDVIRLLGKYPSIAVRLLDHLAARLREAEQRVADVAYLPVRQRVAGTLLRLEQDGVVRLSHQDLAEVVGSHRETVTRILSQLRSEGVLTLDRMAIRIEDRQALAAIQAESRGS